MIELKNVTDKEMYEALLDVLEAYNEDEITLNDKIEHMFQRGIGLNEIINTLYINAVRESLPPILREKIINAFRWKYLQMIENETNGKIQSI